MADEESVEQTGPIPEAGTFNLKVDGNGQPFELTFENGTVLRGSTLTSWLEEQAAQRVQMMRSTLKKLQGQIALKRETLKEVRPGNNFEMWDLMTRLSIFMELNLASLSPEALMEYEIKAASAYLQQVDIALNSAPASRLHLPKNWN